MIAVGDVIAERTVHLTRDDLLRYAVASGDGNPIHQDDAVAAAVGLPGVIAHGMLTMGIAVQPVVDWLRERGGRLLDYGVRFTRMVVVDRDAGADLAITAKVGVVDPDAGTARIDLAVVAGGETVLGKAQVRVALGADRAGTPTTEPGDAR